MAKLNYSIWNFHMKKDRILHFPNLEQPYKKFLVIDVIDILFDNIYFSQVIYKTLNLFLQIWFS